MGVCVYMYVLHRVQHTSNLKADVQTQRVMIFCMSTIVAYQDVYVYNCLSKRFYYLALIKLGLTIIKLGIV